MSGYLQRLFDRAVGSADAPAPALRPGSPLAHHDQRLGIAELASDFGFGSTPDPLAAEGEEAIAPLPPSEQGGSPARPRPAPPAASGEARKPAGDSRLRPQTPSLAGRDSDSELPAAPSSPAAEERRAPAEPLQPVSPLVRPAGKDRRVDAPSLPSGVRQQVAEPASPPVARGEEHDPAPERETVLLRDRPVPIPAEAQPTVGSPLEQPSPEPVGDAQSRRAPVPQERSPRFAELPQARPLEQRTPEPVPAEVPAIDWAAIDKRIAQALGEAAPERPERAEQPPATRRSEDSPGEERRQPDGFTTAAAASVIGPIEHSPRHRMLFGTRWR